MNHSDYFWYGFTACYLTVAAVGFAFVVVTKAIELRKEKKALDKEVADAYRRGQEDTKDIMDERYGS